MTAFFDWHFLESPEEAKFQESDINCNRNRQWAAPPGITKEARSMEHQFAFPNNNLIVKSICIIDYIVN